MHPHAPFDPGHAGPPLFAPFLGGLMLLLLLVAALTLLARGRLGRLPWARSLGGPERDARRILAERFARGEIHTDEFMERASVLNWTPGLDPVEEPRKKRRHHR